MSTEPWALVGLLSAVRFTVFAEPSPGLLPRLLMPFAKRDLTPDRFEAARSGDKLRVDIAMEAMPAEMVHLVAGNIGQTIGVLSVTHRQEITGQVSRRAA